jgi:non-heme chloroperoxidase
MKKISYGEYLFPPKIKNTSLKIYPGAPQGLTSTHKDNVNVDLPSFLKG